MDIKQAKEELRRAFLSYTERGEDGALAIAPIHQRPLLLMGPPGVGKSAVLTQLAQELNTNLVAYTMTHHTRQSALGLPLIREKQFGGKSYSATEYTMSEILATVYERMEKSGIKTGILFLDEINCVSETLMPAILQLLQSKRFGTHALPEGWMIAAAGNPPKYNESARLFDTVTMDRVRLLSITESFPVWRSYALSRGVHPAVLSYLELNPEHFYCIEPRAHGRCFVTARGWEELSQTLFSYERLGFPLDPALFGEYLQHDEISASFAAYFQLFSALQKSVDIPAIFSGQSGDAAPALRAMRFDARLAAIEFLLHALSRELTQYRKVSAFSESLSSFCAALSGVNAPVRTARENLARRESALQIRKDCGAISGAEEAAERQFAKRVHALLDHEDELTLLLQEEARCRQARLSAQETLAGKLENAMQFVFSTFGAGQELLVFLTQLENLPDCKRFLQRSARYQALLSRVLPA